MSAIYGKAFVFGIPTQEEMIEIWKASSRIINKPDIEMIASPEDFLKIRDAENQTYCVEKNESGYALFLCFNT
jgi:hypothetical protein